MARVIMEIRLAAQPYFTFQDSVPVCPGPGLAAAGLGCAAARPAAAGCWLGSVLSSVPADPSDAAWHSPAPRTPSPAVCGGKNNRPLVSLRPFTKHN